ncbi:MAG: hypothetical protein EXR02_06910 [Rhodospirillales bacterium]|nr:hypothetical protein [Rhodospirillales bacterium]
MSRSRASPATPGGEKARASIGATIQSGERKLPTYFFNRWKRGLRLYSRCQEIGGLALERLVWSHTHIENAILMILAEMELNGVSPSADEPVPDRVVLTFATEREAE